MALPLVKLATLAIKQLSKPLANGIKNSVKSGSLISRFPSLSKAITVPAQVYHSFEQRVRMNLLGYTKKIEVKPLSEEAALNLGAELLGEFIIFGVAVGALYAEVKRGQYKDQKKEDVQNQKLNVLQEQISNLSVELSKQKTEHQKLNTLIEKLLETNEKKGKS